MCLHEQPGRGAAAYTGRLSGKGSVGDLYGYHAGNQRIEDVSAGSVAIVGLVSWFDACNRKPEDGLLQNSV